MPFNRAIELISRLRRSKLTCACAESCTGGRIAAAITSIPGASGVFKGGVIAYSNDAKVSLLGVDEEMISESGVVNLDTAVQMAEGARVKFSADYAVATTGIAGPEGGTESKPVGLVFIAWSHAGGTDGQRFIFGGSRNDIQLAASREALEGLLKLLEG